MRLYYKGIWKNQKLVNLIIKGLYLKDDKTISMICKFLINTAEMVVIQEDSDDENETL